MVENAPANAMYEDYSARWDRGMALIKVFWVGLGTGLVFATAGGILLWLSGSGRSNQRPVSLLPSIGPRGATMTLRLRF